MKLNYDCIRYILFTIEASNSSRILASSLANEEYDVKTILYHVECLLDINYLDVGTPINTFGNTYGDYFIFRITMFGHQFIDTIREDNNWNKVKTVAKDAGVTTLKSILTIAENVATAAITKSMGL